VPHWVEQGPAHDERLGGARSKQYPLLIVSNHGRWRMHAQCDDMIWSREVQTMKIRGEDGYAYEPCWLSPREAGRRGIRTGDIVKVFNDRGIVLCGAYVTERIIDRACYVDHGARIDPIIPGWLDRGGAINTISPLSITSSNATGMATSGYLVEVAKVTKQEMEGWRRDYPEAFQRTIDPACGLCLDSWLQPEQP
ncbi:MAG: dehydrogenase, partial [Oscillospiraceae bacterium]|nr:dehydrogenase [Oscillospiraceae bacterium]